MTDAHTPRLLSEADAAADLAGVPRPNDLPSVGTEDARLALTAALGYVERNTPQLVRDEIRSLSAERDELASRVKELQAEVQEQCRINGMGAERELALMARVAELDGERDAAAETACGAVRKAFSLGQTYWQQADSEYTSQHRKAEGTWATFKALIEETRAALSATTPESKP